MTDVLWNYDSIQYFYRLSLYGATLVMSTFRNVEISGGLPSVLSSYNQVRCEDFTDMSRFNTPTSLSKAAVSINIRFILYK